MTAFADHAIILPIDLNDAENKITEIEDTFDINRTIVPFRRNVTTQRK